MMISKQLFRNNNRIRFGRSSRREEVMTSSSLSLSFVFSGEENFEFKNKLLTVHPGSFVAHASGTSLRRSIDMLQPVEYFSVEYDQLFYADFLDSFLRNQRAPMEMRQLVCAGSDGLHNTIHPLTGDLKYTIEHFRQHLLFDQHDEQLIDEYLHHILLSYHQFVFTDLVKRFRRLVRVHPATKVEILKRADLAKNYIFSNYNANVTSRELASYACMSVPHLLRSFKEIYHITPHQLMIRLRLKQAAHLLKDSDLKVQDVVKMVGFDSSSTFIKLFRETYNQTPLHYRRTG